MFSKITTIKSILLVLAPIMRSFLSCVVVVIFNLFAAIPPNPIALAAYGRFYGVAL